MVIIIVNYFCPGWPLEHLILSPIFSILCHCLKCAECEGSRVLDVCPFVFLYPLIRLHELRTTSLFTRDGQFFLNSLLYIFAVGSVFVVIFFRTDIKNEFCAKMTDNQSLNYISNYGCIQKVDLIVHCFVIDSCYIHFTLYLCISAINVSN